MPSILFPTTEKGDRSTTTFTKEVFKAIATAMECPEVAEGIGREKDWRHKYNTHMETVVENLGVLSLTDTPLLEKALLAGLEKARSMDFEVAEGDLKSLKEAMAAGESKFETSTTKGTGELMKEVKIPYHGETLTGASLDSQCDLWAKVGTIEQGAADAIKSGSKKPAELKGRTFLVLGASSELGAVRPLLQAGCTVAAVMRPSEKRWGELTEFAKGTAGTLLAPVPRGSEQPGADLLSDGPAVSEWLLKLGQEAPGPVTLCTYLYADGEANVRLTAAADYIAEAVADKLGKQKVSFSYLVSGSTSHLIPDSAVRAQEENYTTASFWARTFGTRINYAASTEGARLWYTKKPDSPADYHFFRGLVVLQGPNYAVAQYMRLWRAMLLHMKGFTVSAPVTPNCRTDSVVRNATMKVLLEGAAYWKPLESFDADTARLAMFSILVSDLLEPATQVDSPMKIFTTKAFHSGLWRCPFELGSLGATTWVLGKVAPRPKPLP